MADHTDTLHAEKIATAQVEDILGHGAADEARQASDAQHKATFRDSFRTHKAAIFWSAIISLSIVMEGYDTILIGNFWGYPSFKKKYGQDYGGSDGYQVPAHWQAGLSDASTVGTIVGALVNGWSSMRYGYKKTILVSLFLMNCFIFVVFFAENKSTLLAGEFLCGLTWGVFATTGPAYASEVMPLSLRGYLTVYVNLCWAIGQLVAAGVLKGLVNNTTQWSYRVPFAVQWAWPVPLLVIILFAPESPWFFVRHDRLDEARRSLKRLNTVTEEENAGTLAMMVHTVKIENETTSGANYWDCFKGTDLRRTEIVCVAFAGQILSGSSFAYSPAYFFENAGISTDNAYALNLGGTGFAFVGTILSWLLLPRFGRRTIYLGGQIMLASLLLLIGIISAADKHSAGLWAQAALCIMWLFIYSLTVGPITYAIIAETSAVRLRAQTVVLSRNFYQVVNIIVGVIVPYQLNPTEWDWAGRTGFFWAGSAALMALWAYFRLPEVGDRTYEELDILFANKVSARKFGSYKVDAYAGANDSTDVILENNEKSA